MISNQIKIIFLKNDLDLKSQSPLFEGKNFKKDKINKLYMGAILRREQ
jgi:hypothetical protein